MLRVLTAVFVGGALGSALRAIVEHALPSGDLPWGTLVVNIIGSLLLGVLVGGLQTGWPLWLRQGATTGFLGGFTTYSALALWIAQRGLDAAGLAIAFGAAVVGVVMALIGLVTGERLGGTRMPPAASEVGWR